MLSTKYLAHHLTGSENDRRRFCNDSHHSPEKLCWRIIYNFDEINLVEYIIGLPHIKVITPLRFSQKVDAQQLSPVTKAFMLKISGAAVFFSDQGVLSRSAGNGEGAIAERPPSERIEVE